MFGIGPVIMPATIRPVMGPATIPGVAMPECVSFSRRTEELAINGGAEGLARVRLPAKPTPPGEQHTGVDRVAARHHRDRIPIRGSITAEC